MYSLISVGIVFHLEKCLTLKSKKYAINFIRTRATFGTKNKLPQNELFYFSEAQDDAATYAQVMFPINNLGILIYYRRLTNAE
jgi:hypothetical protein